MAHTDTQHDNRLIMVQPELPYAPDSLVPAISARTIQYHWDIHTRTYIDNLNRLVAASDIAWTSVEDII